MKFVGQQCVTTNALADWAELKSMVTGALSSGILNNAEKKTDTDLPTSLREGLRQVAVGEFAVSSDESFAQIILSLEACQARQRENQFPLLAQLRQTGAIRIDSDSLAQMLPSLPEIRIAKANLELAKQAVTTIKDTERAITIAFSELVAKGLIDPTSRNSQVCPICAHAEPATLTPARMAEIGSWEPALSALDIATAAWRASWTERCHRLKELRTLVQRALPATPEDFDSQVEEVELDIRTAAQNAVTHLGSPTRTRFLALVDAMLRTDSDSLADLDEEAKEIDKLETFLQGLQTEAAAYKNEVSTLEQIVATHARRDDTYLLRDRWLTAARSVQAIADELRWGRAKKTTQGTLEVIRKGLIDLRSRLIEDARSRFSQEMSSIWNNLRKDVVSAFDRLEIPSARGRGYKLEFEVRASLGDGTSKRDVSALKVFSESQINVIGIAAYVTRARLLGHTVLIFDDPVQSMDEEHHNSFAADFLELLLLQGFQVIVLTHSKSFARDIAASHFTRDGYVTLTTRLSLSQGCLVDEGSRRVSERLRTAKRLAEEGKNDEAWRLIRLAVERLYVLVKIKNDTDFDHRTWKDHAAEYMWKAGVGGIIQAIDPKSGDRLKRILEFSASGVHDKGGRGTTDLKASIKYINTLLDKLRLSSG